MKKILFISLLCLLLFVFVTPVFAGGGQERGENGQGLTNENFENGCDMQPCFNESLREKPIDNNDNAPRLRSSTSNRNTDNDDNAPRPKPRNKN